MAGVVVLAGEQLELCALLIAGCMPSMLLQHADLGYHWPHRRPAPPCLHWSWPLAARCCCVEESRCLARVVVALLEPARAGEALGLPCLRQELASLTIEEELALVPCPPMVLVVASMGERILVGLACLVVLAHLLLHQQGIWDALGYAQQLEAGLLLQLVWPCHAGQLWLRLAESNLYIPA